MDAMHAGGMSEARETYAHGHHESVLRSQRRRTGLVGSVRGVGRSGLGHIRDLASMWSRCVRLATVGASNRVRSGNFIPNVACIWATIRVANSECPPSSKKLSSMLTVGRPNILANSSHNSCSSGVLGARPLPAESGLGAGSVSRSSVPLGVTGNASSMISAVGVM